MTAIHEATERTASAPGKGDVIKAVGLEKWYGNVCALEGVDFHARTSEVVGLVGDNGAGKSTLIKILSGAQRPDKGKLYVDGVETVLRSPRDAMNRGIETIYQYNAMIPLMDIARNLFIGRELIKWRIGPFRILDVPRMQREAMAAIEDVELRLRSPDALVSELSGGERQGVVIARAMHFKSKVLILDEPTNHLSVKETMKVLDHVEELKSQGITSIFISHNLHHIHPIADRIVVMARGRKVADLNKDETTIDEITHMIV